MRVEFEGVFMLVALQEVGFVELERDEVGGETQVLLEVIVLVEGLRGGGDLFRKGVLVFYKILLWLFCS